MTDLDRKYSPGAWHESGVVKTSRPQASMPTRGCRPPSAKGTAVLGGVLALSISWVGMAGPTMISSQTRDTKATIEWFSHAPGKESSDFIAPEKWADIIAVLDRLPEAPPDAEGPDPEPLF